MKKTSGSQAEIEPCHYLRYCLNINWARGYAIRGDEYDVPGHSKI